MKFFDFPIFPSLIGFQQALSHYHSINFSRDTSKNVRFQVLGPKSSNSDFRPQTPQILKF